VEKTEVRVDKDPLCDGVKLSVEVMKIIKIAQLLFFFAIYGFSHFVVFAMKSVIVSPSWFSLIFSSIDNRSARSLICRAYVFVCIEKNGHL